MKQYVNFVKKNITYIIGAALAAVLIFFAVRYWGDVYAIIRDKAARDAFAAWVKQQGVKGGLVFLALQVLQVVVAVIPGEPVELMAGALYGTLGGLIMCEIGLLIGSVGVYSFVKLAGAKSVPEEELAKYRFLRDGSHVKFALFLLYFVPGTPKDILLYIGPFMPISPRAFFLISTLARIPSVITSTFTSAHLIQGDIKASVIMAVVTGAAALICILNQERILAFVKKINEKRKNISQRTK